MYAQVLIGRVIGRLRAGTLEPLCELARAEVRSAKARMMKQGPDRGPGVWGQER